MSVAVMDNDAWVLSPYCFCHDTPWLSVAGPSDGGVTLGDGGVGAVGEPSSGLSRKDTAILAAVLTALATFLFLLGLLCLLCPSRCCCKKWMCCCKNGKKKRSRRSITENAFTSGNKANISTADMKIPRVWMDYNSGFSDSELYKGHNHTALESRKDAHGSQWQALEDKQGHKWKSFGDSDFINGGWFSTYDNKNIYGKGNTNFGYKGNETNAEALEKFYRKAAKNRIKRDSFPSSGHKNMGYENAAGKLMMSNSSVDLSNHYENKTMRGHGNGMEAYSSGHKEHEESSRFEGDGQGIMASTNLDSLRMAERSSLLSTKDTTSNKMNAAHETSFSDTYEQYGKTVQSQSTSSSDNHLYNSGAQPLAEKEVIIKSVTMTNSGDAMRDSDIGRGGSNSNLNFITEKRSITRRVVEETATIVE